MMLVFCAVNSTATCTVSEFRCNNGRCIKDSFTWKVSQKDLDDNCGDGSDINVGTYE